MSIKVGDLVTDIDGTYVGIGGAVFWDYTGIVDAIWYVPPRAKTEWGEARDGFTQVRVLRNNDPKDWFVAPIEKLKKVEKKDD